MLAYDMARMISYEIEDALKAEKIEIVETMTDDVTNNQFTAGYNYGKIFALNKANEIAQRICGQHMANTVNEVNEEIRRQYRQSEKGENSE